MIDQNLRTDLDALLPGQSTEEGATRRTALKVALGVGYALAATPIVAQTAITTDSDGLMTGTEVYDAAGSTIPFYYAAPKDKADLPVILVVHEIFGVHAHIADMCRRFAKAGYLAIAPDLFARQGDATQYTDTGKLMAEVVSQVPDEQVMGDLDAAVQWAAENGGDITKLGITGFCWGGRITWLYAEYSKQVKAGVAWYGRLVGTSTPLTPKHPLEMVADLNAPVLGLYGGQDGGIPVTTVVQMKEALAAAGAKGNKAAKASAFVLYKDAPHAFNADYRPSYRKEAAEDGFKQCLAWFKSHGLA